MQLRCNIAAAAPLLLFHLAIKISDITLFEKYQKNLTLKKLVKTLKINKLFLQA